MTDNDPPPSAWDYAFPPPPGAYPVEDLAALSPGAAALLLQRAAIDAASDVPAHPHLVITRDVETGQVTRTGPFRSGVEALSQAQHFVEKYSRLEPRWVFSLTVVPVLADRSGDVGPQPS